LRLEGDNDEKSCRDADSLTSCRRVRGMDVQAVVTVGEGPPGCGVVGGGPPGEEREREREREGGRERGMGRDQPLDGAREAGRRERER
jgi:hypothetical protein